MTDDAKAIEAGARAVAEGLGDNYDDAFASKSEWIAERGNRGGRFRDINEPFRCDYDSAAQACIAAYLAEREAQGFVMVPVEPTPEVCEAGLLANGNALLMTADCTDMGNAYRAMIAAAKGEG